MGKNRLPVSPWTVLMSGATGRLQKVLSRPVLSSKLDAGRTSSHHLSSLTLTKGLLLASRFAASSLVATTTSAGASTSTGTSNPDPGINRNPPASTYTSPPNSFSRRFSWGNLLGWDRTLPNKWTTDINLTGHLDDLSSLIRPFLAFLDPFSLSSSYSMASHTSSGSSDLSTPRSSSPHSSASVASARSSHSSTFSAAKRMSISSVRRTSASNPMSSVDLATIEEALKMASLDTLRGYCQSTYGEVHQETTTEYISHEEARGYQVLNQPHWNKGKPTGLFFSFFFSSFSSLSLHVPRFFSRHTFLESIWPCSHHQSLLSVKVLGLSCLGLPDFCTHARLAYIHVSSHLLFPDLACLLPPHLFPAQHFRLLRLCHIRRNRPRRPSYTTWPQLLTFTFHPKGRLSLLKSVYPRT